jgi:peptide/nickel transport system substrate-binding protein
VSLLVRAGIAGALICALAILSACGDDEEPVVRGGTLTMQAASDVDFLDPGRTSFAAGIQVAHATQRTLYTFAPDDLSRRIPDLASGPPQISGGGRVVTVRLRAGVRYSPPVGREVRSEDVKYAIERLFSTAVISPFQSYFTGIAGAPSAPVKGVPDIRAITTPDARKIVFRLRRSTAPALLGALTMVASAPVPEEYARRFDGSEPSTYNTHVVATGPYMVKNDRSGRTVGYRPASRIELVRNPSWSAATDRRPAHLDRVLIRTNATDRTVSARQVLAGHHLVLDSTPPPIVVRDVIEHRRDQAVRVPSGGYRFVPLNTTIKPFDRLDVRRAVLAVFDRVAARKALGGTPAGPIATHFLPPGIPGHDEAGGLTGPAVDFMPSEDGDPAVGERYMRAAGFPTGKYTGDETFLVVAGNSQQERNLADVVRAQFEKLGFRIRLRTVPDDSLFADWCTLPAKKILSCSGILWLKDFPDAEPMLRPVFDGSAISLSGNNTNFSQLDNPRVNAAIAAAQPLAGAARNRAWGDIDRMILDDAAAVPLLWDVSTLIRSKDVDGTANALFDSWDFAYTSLK